MKLTVKIEEIFMKKLLLIIFTFFVCLSQTNLEASGVKIDETDRSIIIENKYFVLTVSKSGKGAIEQIHNKLTGRDLLTPGIKGKPLYRIKALNKDGEKIVAAKNVEQKKRIDSFDEIGRAHV